MRSLILLGAIAVGLIVPGLHEGAFLIKPLLMTLLFFAFLPIHITRHFFTFQSVLLSGIEVGVAVLLFVLLTPFSDIAAMAAFLAAIGPTASAAPSVVSLVHKNVSFVTANVIFSTLFTAVALPFLVVLFKMVDGPISVSKIMIDMGMVLGIPFVLAAILKRVQPRLVKRIRRVPSIPLLALATLLAIAAAQALHTIRSSGVPGHQIILIALVALGVCVLDYSIGRWFGGKLRQETSESIGNKNTMLMVWFASTYMVPAAVLAPAFYLLYNVLYTAWEIGRVKK